MVNRNLIRTLDSDDDLLAEIEAAMSSTDEGGLATAIETERNVDVNSIVEGRVIRVDDGRVLVDVGFKSEGRIPLSEWEDEEEQPKVGDLIQVLVEEVEDGLFHLFSSLLDDFCRVLVTELVCEIFVEAFSWH